MIKDESIKKYIHNGKVRLASGEEMSIEEFANWGALIDGVNEIIDCAQRLNIDVDKTDSWIKPIPIEKYVREKGTQYYNMIMCELKNQQY